MPWPPRSRGRVPSGGSAADELTLLRRGEILAQAAPPHDVERLFLERAKHTFALRDVHDRYLPAVLDFLERRLLGAA